MSGRRRKSKKRSGGKRSGPPKCFQIYLDENLQRCKPILDVITSKGVKVHQHFKYFPNPGEADSTWLPMVGKNKWALITSDDRFRYNELEKMVVIKYKVKVFAFMDNTIGGPALAAAIDKAMVKIINMYKSHKPPFVCSISEKGNVSMRWKPKKGEIRAAAKMQGI